MMIYARFVEADPFQAIREKFAFADTLISLKWSGVEQFLLPHITKYVQWSIVDSQADRLAEQPFQP